MFRVDLEASHATHWRRIDGTQREVIPLFELGSRASEQLDNHGELESLNAVIGEHDDPRVDLGGCFVHGGSIVSNIVFYANRRLDLIGLRCCCHFFFWKEATVSTTKHRLPARSGFWQVVSAFLCLCVAQFTSLNAGPIVLRDASGGERPGVRDGEFAQHMDEAVALLREQLFAIPSCGAYFERLGVDLDAWLSPNLPPYVVPRKLSIVPRRSISPVCGGAQGRPPFEFLFVDKGCFRGREICELASLLLHELGHLARRDTRDNEPPEFFVVCRLSACIDPARYN